ncbi:MAG: YjdF family protein [Bacillota bacterium]|nr:YjdF family protein [Bacillota bacterium]
MNISLTVFFQEPFWVGVFERSYDDIYEVSKVTFGAEPKDYDVYDFILKTFYNIKFSESIKSDVSINNTEKKINPKRLQRKIQQQVSKNGIGTKAQNALKLQFENNKVQRKAISVIKKKEEEENKFILKQEKKKQKKNGH